MFWALRKTASDLQGPAAAAQRPVACGRWRSFFGGPPPNSGPGLKPPAGPALAFPRAPGPTWRLSSLSSRRGRSCHAPSNAERQPVRSPLRARAAGGSAGYRAAARPRPPHHTRHHPRTNAGNACGISAIRSAHRGVSTPGRETVGTTIGRSREATDRILTVIYSVKRNYPCVVVDLRVTTLHGDPVWEIALSGGPVPLDRCHARGERVWSNRNSPIVGRRICRRSDRTRRRLTSARHCMWRPSVRSAIQNPPERSRRLRMIGTDL